jgi:hypothetical protein
MIWIAFHRSPSWIVACSDVRLWERGDTSHGWQDKSADVRRAHVVGWIESFGHCDKSACWRPHRKVQRIQRSERHRPSFCGCRSP